jgi:hypothetical protein
MGAGGPGGYSVSVEGWKMAVMLKRLKREFLLFHAEARGLS